MSLLRRNNVVTRQFDREQDWKSKKVTKVNIELNQDFHVENTTIKLQLNTGNLWSVIAFTRSFQMLPAWKFKKVTQRSTSKLAEILMSRTSLPVVTTWCRQILRHYHIDKELQDAAIWTQPSSKGHKGQTKVNIDLVWDFDMENISVKLQYVVCNSCRVIAFTRQLDLEQVWKLKKITQRSMSNSSKILM